MSHPALNQNWDQSCTDAKLKLIVELVGKGERISEDEKEILRLLRDDPQVKRKNEIARTMMNSKPPF